MGLGSNYGPAAGSMSYYCMLIHILKFLYIKYS